MTQAELEKRLDMIKYYDASNKMCQEFTTGERARNAVPEHRAAMIQIANESIKKNNAHRAEVISLLEQAANESDKEILQRYYVEHQSYFDIAEGMFYEYSYIRQKKSNALKRLAANLKGYPAGSF